MHYYCTKEAWFHRMYDFQNYSLTAQNAMSKRFLLFSPGDSFHIEHRKSDVDFVHPDGFLSLLKFPDKAKPQPGTHRKLFLGQADRLSVFFYKLGDFIHCTFSLRIVCLMYILYLIGYNCKLCPMFYTRRGIKSIKSCDFFKPFKIIDISIKFTRHFYDFSNLHGAEYAFLCQRSSLCRANS